VTYAAKQGETLLAVAARFRTTAKSILSLNFDVALAAVERSVAFALALVLLGSRRPASLSRCPSPSLLALVSRLASSLSLLALASHNIIFPPSRLLLARSALAAP